MDVPALIDGSPLRAPPAVDQPLLPTRAAELSEDGEIFNSDNDDDNLPTLRQISGSPKQVIKMIDLTCDGDGDSEGDDDNHTEGPLEFEPAPKDSKAFITERFESSLKIPETPEVALEKTQRKEDSNNEDSKKYHGGSTQTVVGAAVVAGDAALEVDGASSSLRDRPYNEYNMGSVEPAGPRLSSTPPFSTRLFSRSQNLPDRLSPQ